MWLTTTVVLKAKTASDASPRGNNVTGKPCSIIPFIVGFTMSFSSSAIQPLLQVPQTTPVL